VGKRLRLTTATALICSGLLLHSSLAKADASSGSATDEAKTLISDRCSVCHGENGDGKGPSASSLNPRPKDFHSRAWQSSVNDATLAKAIVYGGPAVGLSASMPANPDLENRPDLVSAIVKQIRAWGK
jgi:mono/diheme cytochrome c family protein